MSVILMYKCIVKLQGQTQDQRANFQ